MKTAKNNQTGIFQKQEIRGRGDISKGAYKGVHEQEKSRSDDDGRSFSKIPKAKKSLGQNFLIDPEALSDIAGAIEISGKHIIEVGPGYGALTDHLIAQKPISLDLVELDPDMVELLNSKFSEVYPVDKIQNSKFDTNMSSELDGSPGIFHLESGIILHHTDILRYTPIYESYSVIANIPYYITSPILFYFLYELEISPDAMVIMMQEEVGEKILEGRARRPHHSFLSLCMEQSCEDIDRVRYVGRSSFEPAPRVDSIVLRFIVKKDRNRKQEQQLIKLWKVAFAHPRKTLLSNMRGSTYSLDAVRANLIRLGYDERVRAEAMRREDWMSFL